MSNKLLTMVATAVVLIICNALIAQKEYQLGHQLLNIFHHASVS